MPPVEAQLSKAYTDALAKARFFYGKKFVSPKRVAIVGGFSALAGAFCAASLGVGLGVGIPILFEWAGRVRGGEIGKGRELLAKLVEQSLAVPSGEIAKALECYGNRGQRKMAAEFLLKLREREVSKFDEVCAALTGTARGKSIKGDFENIKGETSAYRANLGQSQQYFAKVHFSVGKTLAKAGAFFVGAAFFIGEAWIAIPAFAICTGVSVYRNIAAIRGEKKTPCANQLLADLVASMGEIGASIIARDLVGSIWKGSFWRGSQKLTQQALAKLRETDGTKFNEVVTILQGSRRGRSLAASLIGNQ